MRRTAVAALTLVTMAGEVLALLAVSGLAYLLREGLELPPVYYIVATVLVTATAVNLLYLTGCYRFGLHPRPATWPLRALAVWSMTMLLLVLALYLSKLSADFSRTWLIAYYGFGVWAVLAIRLAALAWLGGVHRRGGLRRQVALLGAGDALAWMTRRMFSDTAGATALVGAFAANGAAAPEIAGVPVYGDFQTLHRMIRNAQVDEIVLCFSETDAERFQSCFQELKNEPVDVRYCLPRMLEALPVLGLGNLVNEPVLHLSDRPLAGWSGLVKTVEDRVLGALMVLAGLPLMGLIALAIKLDDGGPVLFRQRRYGFNHDEITVFKFRTMVTVTEEATVLQARPNDPRITRVGRFLRRSSFDELPQLFNVLRGEMSIVGPRPHAVAHNDHYAGLIDGYLARHRVKPGITGWAQVNGLRGETDTLDKMRRRVEHDLHYIENWSLGFDIRIILMTIAVIFTGRNAY